MQILHWPLTCPQKSSGDNGGSISTSPLEQRRKRILFTTSDIFSSTDNSQMSYSARRHSTTSFGSSASDVALNEENDDHLPAYFTLHSSSETTAMDTTNYSMENGDTPIITTGNERNDPGGDNNRPPGDHYNDNRGRGRDEDNQGDEDDDMTPDNHGSGLFGNGNIVALPSDTLDTSRAMLMVNLYSPNRGYTFSCFVPRSDTEDEDYIYHQSHFIPYSETYLLDCIDLETIPTRLLSKLDKYDGINLMRYQSNVLCEVRDYRRFSNSAVAPSPIIQQVVLKPTNQSVLSDLDSLIEKSFGDMQMYKRMQQAAALTKGKKGVANGDEDGCPIPHKKIKLEPGTTATTTEEPVRSFWVDDSISLEQKLELEKEIVRATAQPLCLNPSKSVGLIANRRQFERLKWNSEDLKKSVVNSTKRRERIRRANEKEDEEEESEDLYPGAEDRKSFVPFYRFIKRRQQLKNLEKGIIEVTTGITELLRLPPITCPDFPTVSTPTDMEDIIKFGQPVEPATLRPIFAENFVSKIEEYILETERRKRPHTTRLTIYQRNGSESYFGELEQESFIDPPSFSGVGNNLPSNIRTQGFSFEARVDQPAILSGPTFPSSKCQFELGSSRSVALYVKQFTDIFTEDGRRPCKITYQKVGQPVPQIAFTNSYKSLTTNNNTSGVTNANTSICSPGSPSGPQAMISAAQVQQPRPTAPPPPPVSIAMSMVGPAQTTVPVAGSSSPSSSTSQLPVQIVHPQPRTTQQIQPIQVYTSVGSTAMVSTTIPTSMTLTSNTSSSAATNVNFNLNVNSARIVRQQLLTRPQIINVNLQQQHPSQHILTRQTAPQLIQSQIAQHQGLRLKQQPTLATLLVTGIHPNSGPKPITVAIQPQPQNSSGGSAGQMQAIIGNALEAHQAQQSHHAHQAQQQQHNHQSTSSPIMIMVSPATGNSQNTISIPSSGNSVNQTGHQGSVSLNLNAISLDGLLSSVSSSASNMSNYITTVANTGQMSMGLTNQLNTLNILRLSNSTNTVTLQPQQHAALVRQGSISLMNQGRSGQQQTHTMMNMNTAGIVINPSSAGQTHGGGKNSVNMNVLQKAGVGQTRVQVQTPSIQEIDELSVPDLNSLLNVTSNGNSANFHGSAGQSTATGSLDGHGLNLDLNLNLNLNLSGHTHGPGPSSASAVVSSGRNYEQRQNHTTNGSGEVSSDGVDSFFNALSEAIGPELGQKLDGSATGQSGHNQRMVSSSMSPSTSKTSSVITLNDLLGSPPMMVSSSTGLPPVPSPLQMQLQSPQSPSISSILSPISPNVIPSAPSSLAYSTPRLSALLAGTPSADSTMMSMSNLVDSSTSSTSNSGNVASSTSSYGNLLDRLTASRAQPQITHRTGGSLLSPIATATPSVVLDHPVLAATLTQGPNPNLHLRQGMARPSYRQIAPAPAPQQQQQLINLLSLVSNPTNTGGPNAASQASLRINAGKPSPGASGSLANR